MSYTAVKKELNGITIYDSSSLLRMNLIKHWLHNSFDVIRFYTLMGKMSQIPLIGIPIKKVLYLAYRYMQTNSVILPVKDIEQIIEEASDLCVGPCACRCLVDSKSCEEPIYTCMGINFNATFRVMEKDSKRITKEQALEIVKNANQRGLIMSLEYCIQPYQSNICMCCSDCCLPMQMRYKYKIPVYNSGPYLPEMNSVQCSECGACSKACHWNAIKVVDQKIQLNLDDCNGCGLCAQACPVNCLEMVKKSERVRVDHEPSRIRMYLSVAYIYLMMMPAVAVYKLLTGSQQYKHDAKPRPSDVFDGQMKK